MTRGLWLRALVRGWWIVVLTAAVAVAAALGVAAITPDRYRASATFVVAPDPSITDPNEIVRSFESLVSAGITANYAELLNSASTHREVAAELGLTAQGLKACDTSAPSPT